MKTPTLLAAFGGLLLLSAGACSTFDGIEWVEPGAGGAGGGGGQAGAAGATLDGSSCDRAIDLTGKTLYSTLLRGEGKSQGLCGGGALPGSSCGNPPEAWFKYTATGPMNLGVSLLYEKVFTVDEPCSVFSEQRAFLYARESCSTSNESLCSTLFTLDEGDRFSAVPIKIAKAGTIYFAVDARVSDQNQISLALTSEPICAKDADCKILGRPLCDVSKGICHECLSKADCKDPTESACDTAQGRCVACAVDADCKDPSRPVCSLGECIECLDNSHCKQEGFVCSVPFCLKKITPACQPPAEAPSKGSCVPAGKYPCNPVTNEGCSVGDACDGLDGSFQCYPGANTAKACELCDFSKGVYCAAGSTCQGNKTPCARFCCDDADCGPQARCDRAALKTSDVGLCVAE